MSEVLDSLCTAIVDCEHKTAPEGDGFALSVGTKAMKDGRIVLDACKPVSAETYDGWTRRLRPEPGDLILAREAPVGQVVRVPAAPLVCLGQRTVLIRPDKAKVHSRFLHYWLLGPAAQHVMNSQAAGATVPHLNVADIRALDVSEMPSDPEQQAVTAMLLGALDDLIENNRRRVAVLDEMAKSIYREWFVHFRFPGHEDASFVDSPLGLIPEGWRDTELGSVASVNGSSRKPSATEIVRYLDISCLGDRTVEPPPVVVGSEAPGRARRVVGADDVVWSMVRPNRRAHALLVEPDDDWIASTGLAVITPTHVSGALLFESVSAGEFSDYLVSREGGAAYPAVKPKDFEGAPFLLPSAEVDRQFAEAVDPSHRLIWALRAESERLASIRDLLLPKLVTGEIDVSLLDLDAVIEEAVA